MRVSVVFVLSINRNRSAFLAEAELEKRLFGHHGHSGTLDGLFNAIGMFVSRFKTKPCCILDIRCVHTCTLIDALCRPYLLFAAAHGDVPTLLKFAAGISLDFPAPGTSESDMLAMLLRHQIDHVLGLHKVCVITFISTIHLNLGTTCRTTLRNR